MDKSYFNLINFYPLNPNTTYLSTLTIKAKDGEFKANPDLWSSICPAFAAMLKNKMKEATTLTINFPTFTIDCIKQLYYATFTNSNLDVSLLEEFMYLADQYELTNLLNSCVKLILTLPPYQKFFDYNNQFNLNIYNKLVTNFFKLNNYIPIYNDDKIYLDLWQQVKDKFYPIDLTNIVIKSYLASNLNSTMFDEYDKNKNNLITSLDSVVIDKNVNIDIITNLRLKQLKILIKDSELLGDADYKDIEDFLVYNVNKNNKDSAKIYALNQYVKNDNTLEQKQLKLNYRTGEWTIVNQILDIKYKV